LTPNSYLIPIELASAHAPVGIMTLKNRTLTPVAQFFMDCAREVAKPMAMPRRRQLQRAWSLVLPAAWISIKMAQDAASQWAAIDLGGGPRRAAIAEAVATLKADMAADVAEARVAVAEAQVAIARLRETLACDRAKAVLDLPALPSTRRSDLNWKSKKSWTAVP
jgi:hypothetical protein